ncbi:MAG: VPLPA-CTERM sorting domain-containing protein [Gammaproteobacteria bacterium]|nr:VPLPA-CTERM sorting domain-containing protein [Gammaproteobacteria bacterium]
MKTTHLILAAGLLVASASAQATSYFIVQSGSNLSDVRKIGGQNIPEIGDYTGFGGSLDPTNPLNWPILDSDFNTLPDYTGYPGTPASNIDPNFSRVNGIISVVGGSVQTATINQVDPLGYGAYQSATVINNLVTNGLVWTYDASVNPTRMSHQSGGGTAATSSGVAACVPLVGTGISGQCRQLAAAINASGDLGQTTIGSSIWNWTGVAPNVTVRDTTSLPWHTATMTSTGPFLPVAGPSGHPGIVWDLTGFTDGVGGTIVAWVTADALQAGASSTTISARYTLTVTPVPVPAAVWLFGSAVGVLGWARRRAA